MSGTGTTVAIGGLTIGDPAAGDQEFLDQRTLDNDGAATLADYYSYGLYLQDGATFDNRAGASFAFVTDTSIQSDGGSPSGGSFDNEGTLSKTAGTGTSTIGVPLVGQGGAVDVETGTIALQGGGSLGGTMTVTGLLSAQSGTLVLGDGLDVTGTGTLGLTGGELTVAGSVSLPGLNQSGGTLDGSGTLTVNGPITWTGGYESGTGTTDAEGGLTIGDPAAGDQEFLDQRTLDNDGAATLADYYSYGLYLQDGATFDNRAGASFAFVTDTSIQSDGGSPSGGSFDNEGTLSKTAGTGTSTIGGGVTLTDTGTIEADTGTLSLQGGGSLGGAFTVTGAVSLDSGAFVLEDGLTASGTGTVKLTGATATVAGAATLPYLAQTGGTLTGPGTLTVTGLTTWTGGYESGTGTTDAEGGLTIGDPAAGDQEFLDQRTLDNDGAATLADYYSYGLYLQDGATFDNRAGASFAFVTDTSIQSDGGSPSGGSFDNEGTLSKTAGTGTSTVGSGVVLNSSGTVEALSGTLQLSGGTFAGTIEATAGASLTMTAPPTNLSATGTLTGATWIVGASSSMSLDAGITTDAATIVLNGAGADFSSLSPLAQIASGGSLQVLDGGSFTTAGDLDNAGTIDLVPGTLNAAGNYTQEVSGSYDVGVGGPAAGSQLGQLDVNGLATLDGVLDASLIDGYSPPLGESDAVLTVGSVTGDFSAEFGLEFENGAGFTPRFNPGTNPTELDLVVVAEAAGTQTTLQSSRNPSNYSDLVTFTVNVTPVGPAGKVPAGTVTLYDNGTAIDTRTLVNGSASFTTSALTGGRHSIVAQYNGDADFSRGNSTGFPQVVNQVDSTTTVKSSLNPSIGSQSVTFTAIVSPVAAGDRNAHRDRHVLRRHHGHRHRDPERRHGVLHHLDPRRRWARDQRRLRGRHQFHRQPLDGHHAEP